MYPTWKGQEEEIQGIYFEKEEIKLALFTSDMILYIKKNSTDSTPPKKKLIRTNEFCKVAEYKINTQKSVTFLYGSNEKS